jgi:hypothetical protein
MERDALPAPMVGSVCGTPSETPRLPGTGRQVEDVRAASMTIEARPKARAGLLDGGVNAAHGRVPDSPGAAELRVRISGWPNECHQTFWRMPMPKTAVVMLAPLLLLAGSALAQNATPGTTTPSNQSQANTPSTQSQANKSSQANQKSPQMVRQQVQKNLQQAGFTDIQIMPSSFLVRAKDKDGNPVMMVLNPDSMTAVTEIPGQGKQTTGKGQ